jgi:FMN phosphatase YigB (HAD superfamily)
MLSDVTIEDIVPRNTIDNKIFDEAIDTFYHDVSKQLSQLTIYPDFESTIQFLKNNGYQTAVVSNLSKLYAYPLDHMISKETFDYKALSFELGVAKPDTKIFETLQQKS